VTGAVKRFRWLGVGLLLGLLLAQMAFSSARKSAAFDETYHLVAGYAYLRTGDPRLSWEHPPLAQVLAALPLLARDDITPIPVGHPAWQAGTAEGFADEYLWGANGAIAPQLVRTARWPLMGLTLLFGLALFLALRSTVGETAAWAGLVLFILDPNIVGNGRLVTNDLPVSGWMFVAVWRLTAYLRRPTAANLLAAGLAAGAAAATKFSALLLGPIFLLLAAFYRPPGGHSLSPARRMAALVGMGAVAALTVWAVLGFEVGPLTEDSIPLPAPTYLRGMPGMARRIARGTPTYLLGRVSESGWWHYFPLIFLLKTPLPTLLLILVGLPVALRRWRETLPWWGSALLYLAVASASPLQIGYRYILPVLFFSFPLAAMPFRRPPHRQWARVALALMLTWTAAEAALIFPDHLSYVNQLGGGRDDGWRVFADQNVDWGQDLPALREYAAAHDLNDLRLAYFGSAYPAAYGVRARLLPGFSRLLAGPERFGYNPYTPPPGTYAISATSLHLGLVYERQDLYAFFRDLPPEGRAGRSILIYRVAYPPGTPVDRAVVVGPEVASVSPDRLGWQAGHRLIVKWAGAGAFVLAGGGPARYVIEAPVPDSPLVAAVLSAEGDSVDARPLLDSIPSQDLPTTPTGVPVPLPAPFQDGPALAGWTLSAGSVTPGDTLTLTTYWRVEGPLQPPLAVFVHLLGEDSLPIAQWDGWPVATDGLEPGDVVVVAHPLRIPPETPPGERILQVGLYRPPDGPRLPVVGSDRLILTTVRIETREQTGRTRLDTPAAGLILKICKPVLSTLCHSSCSSSWRLQCS